MGSFAQERRKVGEMAEMGNKRLRRMAQDGRSPMSAGKRAAVSAVLVLCVSAVGSCAAHRPEVASRPAFLELYEAAGEPIVESFDQGEDPRITIRAVELPLRFLGELITEETGMSLVWSEGLDDRTVTLELEDRPVSELVNLVGRRMGVEVQRMENAYYLGDLRAEDRALLVRRTGRLSREELNSAVRVLLTDSGEATVFDDGVVVVSDKLAVIRRVERMLSQVEERAGAGWLVQLFFVEDVIESGRVLGVDVVHDIELGAALSDVSSDFGYRADVRAQLFADLQRSDVRLVNAPVLLTLDGKSSSQEQVTTQRIPIFATLESGAVTQTGFEEIDTGLRVDVRVRESSWTSGTLSYSIEVGQVTGESGGAPTEETQRQVGDVRVVSGGTYLLGSLYQARTSEGRDGFFGAVKRRDYREVRMRIFAMLERVDGPLVDGAVSRLSDD